MLNRCPLVIGLHEKSRISSFIKLENKLRALTGRSPWTLRARRNFQDMYVYYILIFREKTSKRNLIYRRRLYLPSHTGCELERYFWIKKYVLRFDFMTLDLLIVADTNVNETQKSSQNISTDLKLINWISNNCRLQFYQN